MTKHSSCIQAIPWPFPIQLRSSAVVVTNGMVDSQLFQSDDYERMNALGVTQYGQMTAGSYMYIGPQGIVHGTTITLLNAARLHLGLKDEADLSGITFITSGLGGMSGAQAKAATIAGAACIIAETNAHAHKRHEQGWLTTVTDSIDEAIDMMVDAAQRRATISIGLIGNIVELWERCVERNIRVDLGSDQTSLHNPYQGGYFPADRSYEESATMLSEEPERFKKEVQATLRRHASAINTMAERGMYFWDYGNAFLLEASRVGAEVVNEDGSFAYPSYVEDIMGPMCFDYGFGPYRWVCTSGDPSDLAKTDEIAANVLREMLKSATDDVRQQISDNLRWIEQAGENNLVVGSQARILYADDIGRRNIARAMNAAIASGAISGPVVLGRDHHDVSEPTARIEKPPTSMTVLCSQQIWPFTTPSVIHSVVRHGSVSIMAAVLAGARSSTVDLACSLMGLMQQHNDWRACFTGTSTTVLHDEHGHVIPALSLRFNGRWKRNQNSRLHYQPWSITTFLMQWEVGR